MKIKSINENFSKNLRRIRKHLGLSQEGMAQMLHTTKQTIFRYEKGEIVPGLNILVNLSKNLNVNLNWLLKNEAEKTNDMFMREKPVDYGVYEEDKREMNYLMDNIPFVRSSILKHFILYKHENKEKIRKFLENNDLNQKKEIGHDHEKTREDS